tara:strand:+ start:10149 stop:10556 length:408 start_codon:yes stop_codon:yes gene_type:complete
MPTTISGIARIKLDTEEIYHEIACELQMDLETKERETKDTNGTEFRAGKKSWSASGNGLQLEVTPGTEHTFSALFAKWDAAAEIAFEFSTGVSADKYYFGQGLITNLTVSAEANEDPTASWSVQGTGVLAEGTVV